jgi:hypothetical protein
MNRRVKRVLLYVLTLAMLLTVLPAAAADGVQTKGSMGWTSILNLGVLSSYGVTLPELSKPAQKIIPRHCATVRQNDIVTIPVTVSPASIYSLNDLIVKWDVSKLIPVLPGKPKVSGGRVTIYLRFMAIGKPTDTTKVSYYSTAKPATQSRTYVTIVPQPVTAVVLNPPFAYLEENGDTYQLSAVVLPTTASNLAVRWYSTNPKVAKVSSTGLVTPLKLGEATIYVVTKSGGKRARCKIFVMPHLED